MSLANEQNSTSIIQTESRFEIFWRTLLADCFEQSHPAPPGVAHYFVQDIWTLVAKNEAVARERRQAASIFGRLANKIRTKEPNRWDGYRIKEDFASPWITLMANEPPSSEFGTQMFFQIGEEVGEAARRNQDQNPWFAKMWAWRREINIAFGRRRVFRTDTRLLGLGPIDMQANDEVWVLAGGSTPFVLRPDATGTGRYRLLGSAYVHGIMHGEAVAEFDESRLRHIILE
jgi:hypothetical protein